MSCDRALDLLAVMREGPIVLMAGCHAPGSSDTWKKPPKPDEVQQGECRQRIVPGHG